MRCMFPLLGERPGWFMCSCLLTSLFSWNVLNAGRVYAGLGKCCWSRQAWTLELNKVGFKSWHFLLWTFFKSFVIQHLPLPSPANLPLTLHSPPVASYCVFPSLTSPCYEVFNLPSYQKDFLCCSWPPRVLLECFCPSGSSLTSGDLFL